MPSLPHPFRALLVSSFSYVPYDLRGRLTSCFFHFSVSAYGIKLGSTIALVGGGDPIKPPSSKASSAHAAKAPRTEESTISQIRGELDKVRGTLKSDVDTFLLALSPAGAPAHVGPEPTAAVSAPKPASVAVSSTGLPVDLGREHARLGELLLQSLLRLDAINAEGEWEVARRERKGAVKEVQGLLDRLDGGWRARARS